MTNSIVELFNQTDKQYKLVYLEGCSKDLWIISKSGNTDIPELNIGNYGIYAVKVFQFLTDLFTEHFGEGEYVSFSLWKDNDGHDRLWYYNGFFLELILEPEHPKISGYNVYIKTGFA